VGGRAARERLRAALPALALALAAALAAAPAGAAGAEDSFREGMSALDQNKWGVAAAAFRAALAERPEEGGRRVRIYGTWLLDYLPHYYLGVALFQLDDLEGAAAEWRESRRQGAILTTPLVADLERWESRLPRELRAAGREAASVAAQSAAPETGGASREKAPAPPVAPAPAPPAASAPAGDGSAPSPAPGPAPSPEVLPAAGPPAEAERRAPVAPTTAPDGRALLLAAARLYFDGRYRETLSELAAARWPGRAPARACLLESASALALYRQAGAADARYLERARSALSACPAISARDRPDPRLFSPAFTQLFDETLAARGAPAPARGKETP
jgi:hypothetical protein